MTELVEIFENTYINPENEVSRQEDILHHILNGNDAVSEMDTFYYGFEEQGRF